VKIQENWGYINRSGKITISGQFLDVRRFVDNQAAVRIVAR
jgi:hypothetical protein